MSAPTADGRLGTFERGEPIEFTVDGVATRAYAGETIAAALLAGGVSAFRTTETRGEPRSYYCGMGICFECLVRVDGRQNVRACMTRVRAGMRVEREHAKVEAAHP